MGFRIGLFFLIIALFTSCNGPISINSAKEIGKDSMGLLEQTDSGSLASESELIDADTIALIEFKEISIFINRLKIYDEDNIISTNGTDSVVINAELGEKFEGQIISYKSEILTDIIIEQRYQTSVTIMKEGPHCDLTDWKHFYSDWKRLEPTSDGQYISDSYSEKEQKIFPNISIEDLKKEVKNQCGEDWFQLVDSIKNPNDYPSGVSISRYYLKVTGKNTFTNSIVTKIIVIENQMGC
jgi:hypothetical protein